MEWYWIVLITIVVFNTIGTILALMNKEELCAIWGCFLGYLITRYLLRPIYFAYKKIKKEEIKWK